MHCRKDRHVAPMVQTTSLQPEMLKKKFGIKFKLHLRVQVVQCPTSMQKCIEVT